MKNQDFELKLLLKQNTQMAVKLQAYRRENQELALKNRDLNCWVQNLSEVFASISSAWKIITDNEEALYTLMRKKSDPNSKQLVGKYISHFRAFDEIITNLGEKITNQGHSSSATLDAKSRLSSFVSNYNLFFLEFVETYFKFNEECISMTNEKLKEPNLPAQMRQIANQSLEHKLKIREFEEFITKMSQNYKLYETYNQHQLLDGIIIQQAKEIEVLKDRNLKQARRIAYMTDYNTDNVQLILQKEDNFQCYCGGASLKYYNQVWEEYLKNQSSQLGKKQSSHQMMDEEQEDVKEKIREIGELQVQKQLLIQRNVQVLAKCEKIKLHNKMSDEAILQSPLFIHLRNQFKDLMDYTNDLTLRLNKTSEYINEMEKARYEQIEQLKKKYQKSSASSRHRSEHLSSAPDHTFLQKFKERVQNYCIDIKNKFSGIHKGLIEREEGLMQNKQSLKILKKENEDLNRRLGELQERQLKNVEQVQFRHQKFNDLEKSMNQIFRSGTNSEQLQKTNRLWQQFAEYTKTRDKKIKAMEDMIKRKEKEVIQKQKVQEVMKSAMAETEAIYEKYKEKLGTFQQFMKNIEKEILNLSQENYKIKIESEQQKNILNIRLKNELEVKAKLEEKVKASERIEQEVKATKNLEIELEKKLNEFQTKEKDKNTAVKIQLKEKDRKILELTDILNEKDKNIEKLIEDKEKKNLEIDKLHYKINSSSENEILRMELEEYKSKIMCRCGTQREREVMLKTCPHIFCKKCIDDATANRNRKCPICGIRFTKTDVHQINWT